MRLTQQWKDAESFFEQIKVRSIKFYWNNTMGMQCEINSILKLNPAQGYPSQLEKGKKYSAQKSGYRIIVVDTPIPVVDENWFAHADIKIYRLVWENGVTSIDFEIDRVYESPFLVKKLDA